MKKIFSLLCVFLCALFLPFQVNAVVEQSDSFYVNDAANVLSPETEDRILAINEQLVTYCNNAQLVVVSVPYMDGLYADEYAYQIFNDWGIGNADENNGILLVFATEENKCWLTTGSGIGIFNDAIAEFYLEHYFWDYYDTQQYDKGVTLLCDAIYRWCLDYYDVNTRHIDLIPEIQTQTDSRIVKISDVFFKLLKWFIIAVFIYYLFVERSQPGTHSAIHIHTSTRPYIKHRSTKQSSYHRTSSNLTSHKSSRSRSSSSRMRSSSRSGFGGRSGGGRGRR